MRRSLACSFCGRDDSQVQRLIAGPRVFICDACVERCNAILAESGPPTSAAEQDQGPGPARSWWRRFFDGWRARATGAPIPEPR